MIITAFLAFVGGLFLWTAGEYHLHRFAMHHLRGWGIASREHLIHHADPILTDLRIRLLGYLGIVVVGTIFGLLLSITVGTTIGFGIAAGWTLGYLFYELLHWRAHHRACTNRYERWLRRHHFHHHFGHPMDNHGVTTALWDRIYRTYQRPDRVRVPRRMAMFWLLDDDGEVAEEFRDHYVLVGKTVPSGATTEDQAAEDHRRAFANQAPTS